MNKGIGKFEAFNGKLPPNESRLEGLFNTFLEKYSECPNMGIFKSDGSCPNTTIMILKKLMPRVKWNSEKAIVFFKREKKSKLVNYLERELIKEQGRFFQSQATDADNFKLQETCRCSFNRSLDDYITVGLQSELNVCLELGSTIKFERDVFRLLIRYFNFELIKELKLGFPLDECLSNCLHKELQQNLCSDLLSTTSLVCLTKSGIFLVVLDENGHNGWVEFFGFDSIVKCQVMRKPRCPTVEVTFDNGSKVSIDTESLELAKKLRIFISITAKLSLVIKKTNKSVR